MSGQHAADREPEARQDGTSRFGIAPREVVVGGDQPRPLTGQSVHSQRERRREGFSLAGLHLNNVPSAECVTGPQLHVVGDSPATSRQAWATKANTSGTISPMSGCVRHVSRNDLSRIARSLAEQRTMSACARLSRAAKSGQGSLRHQPMVRPPMERLEISAQRMGNQKPTPASHPFKKQRRGPVAPALQSSMGGNRPFLTPKNSFQREGIGGQHEREDANRLPAGKGCLYDNCAARSAAYCRLVNSRPQ